MPAYPANNTQAEPHVSGPRRPLGALTSDRSGADRTGDGLYGNSLVALDARTGEKTWYRQLVLERSREVTRLRLSKNDPAAWQLSSGAARLSGTDPVPMNPELPCIAHKRHAPARPSTHLNLADPVELQLVAAIQRIQHGGTFPPARAEAVP
jgi:hypothetical protein